MFDGERHKQIDRRMRYTHIIETQEETQKSKDTHSELKNSDTDTEQKVILIYTQKELYKIEQI